MGGLVDRQGTLVQRLRLVVLAALVRLPHTSQLVNLTVSWPEIPVLARGFHNFTRTT